MPTYMSWGVPDARKAAIKAIRSKNLVSRRGCNAAMVITHTIKPLFLISRRLS